MDMLIDKILSQESVDKLLQDFYEHFKKIEKEQVDIGKELTSKDIAKMIDHTLLKPDATIEDIKKLCEEARLYEFASVCVNPCYVSLCCELLKNSSVKTCTVIGFPLGATTTDVKCYEAEQALKNGAAEIDMVINVGMLKQGEYQYVFNDINQVVSKAKKYNAVCKVIIETSLLTDKEKVKVCLISKHANADFVKTSTGFSKGGATAADVALMKYIIGSNIGVKASGGIRTYEDAILMIKSGANRIGTSSGVNIVNGKSLTKGDY